MSELYLNMGYYTIRIYPASQDMTMIITEFGKFGYNHLPMGMCTSVDNLQSKVNKIIGDIGGVKAYINDILAFSKGLFGKHIKHLRIIFGRMRAAGLKVNALKCSFVLK